MRKGLLFVIASLALSGCFSHTGPLAPFPLEYRGVDSAPSSSTAVGAALGARTIRVEPLVDKRTQPTVVGVYEDEGTQVESSSNVSAFYTQQFEGIIQKATGKVVPSGQTTTIKGEILDLKVVEGGMYTGQARLHVQVVEKGAVVWDAVYEGTSKRWGKSHTAENYNEALSNSFTDAVRRLLNDDSGLANALNGGKPATSSPPPPRPARRAKRNSRRYRPRLERTMDSPRFAITASSVANVLGQSTRAVLDGIFAGTQKLAPPSSLFPLSFDTHVGEMTELPPASEIPARADIRLTRIALCAARELKPAVESAISRFGATRVALVLGACTGGLDASERAFPRLRKREEAPGYDHDLQHPVHVAAFVLADYFGVKGPVLAVSTACSSSAKAIGIGTRFLRRGQVDAVIACGADSLCATTLTGFRALGALSSGTTRPFAADRDGISIGEGAGFMLLERGARADVYVAGVGESSDAYHLSSPDPTGNGPAEAMRLALLQAGLDAQDVDHVNAHGTGTPQNDDVEAKAIAAVFGREIPITTTKPMTGHLLGAAGITEAIIAAETIRRGRIPPTITRGEIDRNIDANIVREPSALRARAVVSNSLAFGGSNAAVVIAS
jgi:3-oxoacyl-[acyl-carrier-protein] synthase-1